MLTYLLALVVGLGSLALYLSAFFYPQVYRKGDLIWSGVGLFYALVLWVCAPRITGGVMLGQIASVSLLSWLSWQTFNLRLQRTPSEELPASPDLQAGLDRVLASENVAKLKQQFSNLRQWGQALLTTSQSKEPAAPTPQPYQPLQREDFGNPPVTVETNAPEVSPLAAEQIAAAPVTEVAPEIEAAQPAIETAQPATDKPSFVTTLTDTVKSIAASFKKPQKNTSTYVRKDFRDATPPPVAEDVDADAFDFDDESSIATEAVAKSSVPVNQDAVSDATIEADGVLQKEIEFESSRNDLEIPQPTPPHPPTPDLVEAAIADAEAKHIPADPPETTEAAEDK